MMKKIVFAMMMMLVFSGAFAQNKTQEKKIKYFVEAATKEFSLDAAQSKQLLDARNAYITGYMDVMSKVKNEGLSDEDKKNQLNEVNKDFNNAFSKITGKPLSELQPFFARMRDELNKI
ncbi:hypothetical protein [Flavobacterium sp. UMI-01]|uniref:hypothetical protein n=1 Tax=Flavobacterium sp. UMI-01 TaxID=1441053 RepID=UPI001C7CC6C0|nr:hypothetical protein [Flavobacterium sp. UMI-01]GIZ08879.1 hypothetical protein FUMI01_16060 [Flavobacterium sp. UMI-01]